MSKMESSGSNTESKETATRTIASVLAFSVAAFVASGVSYGAPPKPGPDLNDKVCKSIGGAWKAPTCTIPEGTAGVASSNFRLSKAPVLDIKGSLTINRGVTVDSDGTIIVENTGGVGTEFDQPQYLAGLLVLGTLDNSGAITIKNETTDTEGITVSVSYSPNDASDPNPFTIVPGTLSNSGTITIQNRYQTRGIKNLGLLDNSAPGVITVANSGTTSVGIYNRRDNHLNPGYYYVAGTLTNAGRITISNSGANGGYGIYNGGVITTTGSFTINASSADPDDLAGGFYNSGSFTNYGTLTNNRGTSPSSSLGSFNSGGTMINYGTTYVGTADAPGGVFVNWEGSSMMINLGKIINWGGLIDVTQAATMVNYGTIFNYGGIGGGTNRGICIDEIAGAGECYSGGD